MRQICETCGSQGWKGLLVTCSKCRIACEHRYCMAQPSFDISVDFICADCSSKQPIQNSFTSSSIKAISRSQKNKKTRVESSNPVPRWKKIPETSKMKLISPEEVKKLSCGINKSTFKVPRPVLARSTTARSPNSTVMAHKTNLMNLFPTKKVEPRCWQIQSGVTRDGTKLRIGNGGGKDIGSSKEICQSILSEKLLQLLPYRPALQPTWRGHIVDSVTPSKYNGEFWAQPASEISGKAYKLSKKIPLQLKVKLVPIGNLLKDLFVNRNPALSDVEMYIFPNEKNTKRYKEEHGYLFEAMKTRNAMIRINIKDTPLLIFSSKLLDKSSQIMIKMQKKTDNFLWGIFLLKKKSLAYLPGTSS